MHSYTQSVKGMQSSVSLQVLSTVLSGLENGSERDPQQWHTRGRVWTIAGQLGAPSVVGIMNPSGNNPTHHSTSATLLLALIMRTSSQRYSTGVALCLRMTLLVGGLTFHGAERER